MADIDNDLLKHLHLATKDYLDFDSEWVDSYDGLRGAVRGYGAPSLAVGEAVKSSTGKDSSIGIVIVGTQYGNIVIYSKSTSVFDPRVMVEVPDEISSAFNKNCSVEEYGIVYKIIRTKSEEFVDTLLNTPKQ